jgi:RNA polymerase sigma factor (sigma-70 family)
MRETEAGTFTDVKLIELEDGTILDPPRAPRPKEFLSQILPFVPLATRYVARKIPAADVDDVIQESLLRVMNSSRDADVRHPKSYFFTVVKAVIVDRGRHEAVRHRKDHCEMNEAYHPVDPICPCRVLEAKQSLLRVMARLDAVPGRSRDMVLAVRLEGLTFREVAKRHNVSLSTVEKQVASVLAQLAEAMTGD